MKFTDILRMAIHNLRRRQMRTALNLIGVVIGCTVLLMTAAGGSGVGVALRGLLNSSEYARQISIYSNYGADIEVPEEYSIVEGDMSDERRERIREVMANKWREENIPWSARQLNVDVASRIERIPHVVEVVPDSWVRGVVHGETESLLEGLEGCSAQDRDIAGRVISGKMLSGDDTNEVLIHEYLAYRLGYHSDQELEDLIDREISFTFGAAGMRLGGLAWAMTGDERFDADSFQTQLELATAMSALMNELDATSLSDQQKKLLSESLRALREQSSASVADPGSPASIVDTSVPDVSKTVRFRVVGVVRSASYNDPWALFRQAMHGGSGSVLTGYRTARSLQAESGDDLSFYQARVTVDSVEHLAEVVAALEEESVHTSSALSILENVDHEIDRITFVIYGIAAAILFIACLGISNTLIISVMERTPEFGIMKSLGARDSHIMVLMITEGGFVGALGAVLSVILSWLLGAAGDGILKSYLETRVADEIQSGLFSFSPAWIAAVTGVSIIVCMLASLLPAWRASRLDPVVAMRRT